MKPGNGKRTRARCGHQGEFITANYIACLEGCDETERTDPEIKIGCPKCNSTEIEYFVTIWGRGRHCLTCGKVFH